MAVVNGIEQDPNAPGFRWPWEEEPPPDTTGNDNAQVLGSAGLKWISGNGDSAIWQLPNGARVSEGAALDMVLGGYDETGKLVTKPSPIEPAPQQKEGATKYQTVNGQTYYEVAPGRFEPVEGLPTTAQAGGGSGATAGQQLDYAARNAALQEQIRMNGATIDRNGRLDALAVQQQSWLQQKETLARADNKEELAQQTSLQLAGIQTQRDRLSLDTQVAQQQAFQAQKQLDFNIAKANMDAQQRSAEFNSSGQQRTGEFNATQGLATERANNEAEAQRRRDIADQAEKIGVLGQDTGNRGRFAAFAAANKGFGSENTAIGQGLSLIDSQSVQPLETSLGNKAALEASNARPYSFTPLTFNPVGFNPLTGMGGGAGGPLSAGGPGIGAGGIGGAAPPRPMPTLPAAMVQKPGPTSAAYHPELGASTMDPAQGGAYAADWTPATIGAAGPLTGADTQNAGQFHWDPEGTGGIQRFEKGGIAQGAFMAGDSSDGEENPEIVIPLGAGGAMIVSTRGMKPERVKALKKGMQKFATGGLFDQLGDDAKLSKGFLTDASSKFRQGTPWAGKAGALPSPVYGSSPGFSPLLNSLLASGRALEQGIPVEYANWLTNRMRPETISGINGVSRSA